MRGVSSIVVSSSSGVNEVNATKRPSADTDGSSPLTVAPAPSTLATTGGGLAVPAKSPAPVRSLRTTTRSWIPVPVTRYRDAPRSRLPSSAVTAAGRNRR